MRIPRNLMIKRLQETLWVAYILLYPLYLLPSGLPQVADWLFGVLAMVTTLTGLTLTPSQKQVMMAVVMFASYITVVNCSWALVLNSTSMLVSSLYYIYNAIVIIVTMSLASRLGAKFWALSLWALILSILWQIVVVLFAGAGLGSIRVTGTFNNPNQLGYFALLSVSIIGLIGARIGISGLKGAVGVIGAAVLAAASLSKAAILSMAIGLILKLKNQARLVLPMITILVVLLFYGDDSVLVQGVAMRIAGIGAQTDDTLAGRGYDRILLYPEYWIFGAGEGEYHRFDKSGLQAELHSSLGNVFFSYGAFGLVLFCCVLYLVVRTAPWHGVAALVPLLLYGLTHQGLRASLFWVVLGLTASLGNGVISTSVTRKASATHQISV